MREGAGGDVPNGAGACDGGVTLRDCNGAYGVRPDRTEFTYLTKVVEAYSGDEFSVAIIDPLNGYEGLCIAVHTT
jgi:hypothetical protein